MGGWTLDDLYDADPEEVECIIEMMQEEHEQNEQARLQAQGM